MVRRSKLVWGFGFTLIELLISLVIFSIVIGFIYSVLSSGRSTFYVADAQLDLQQQFRQAIDTMTKELRQTNSSILSGVPADGLYYSNITFNIPSTITNGTITWSDDISYWRNSNNQVIRNSTDGVFVLANYVTNLSFRRQGQTAEIVEIYLTGNKTNVFNRNIGFSLNSQVRLRN